MAKLTEKQEKFAQGVGIEGLSQSDAYRRAYSCGNMAEKSIHVNGCKLAGDANVAQRIAELKKTRIDRTVSETTFTVRKLMETYIAIAMVDANELISVKVGCCRHCHGDGFQYQWREDEYVQALNDWERQPNDKTGAPKALPDPAGGFGYKHFTPPHPDCPRCGGEGVERVVPMDTTKLSPGAKHLYRGAQQTKDGIKILFGDKDKALDQIGRILGAYDDKMRIDLEGKVASLRLTTTDPKEAADAYERMLKGS